MPRLHAAFREHLRWLQKAVPNSVEQRQQPMEDHTAKAIWNSMMTENSVFNQIAMYDPFAVYVFLSTGELSAFKKENHLGRAVRTDYGTCLKCMVPLLGRYRMQLIRAIIIAYATS